MGKNGIGNALPGTIAGENITLLRGFPAASARVGVANSIDPVSTTSASGTRGSKAVNCAGTCRDKMACALVGPASSAAITDAYESPTGMYRI